jgi:hypothetical protein
MAKGKKTSIYLNPPLAELAETKGEPLPDALYRGLAVVPILEEWNDAGGFTVRWFCEVPPRGAKFQVLHGHWIDAPRKRAIREIYAAQVLPEAEGQISADA